MPKVSFHLTTTAELTFWTEYNQPRAASPLVVPSYRESANHHIPFKTLLERALLYGIDDRRPLFRIEEHRWCDWYRFFLDGNIDHKTGQKVKVKHRLHLYPSQVEGFMRLCVRHGVLSENAGLLVGTFFEAVAAGDVIILNSNT